MADKSVAKINAAIRSCLERCYGDKTPRASIADFIGELREDPHWREAEIEEVELTVLKMLSLIVEKPEDDSHSSE
jgi:hypothetical protein